MIEVLLASALYASTEWPDWKSAAQRQAEKEAAPSASTRLREVYQQPEYEEHMKPAVPDYNAARDAYKERERANDPNCNGHYPYMDSPEEQYRHYYCGSK